jgi:glycosyltransferase involved in cell wall biosynthesis
VISLILPYFNRAAATDRALTALAEHYPDLDLEVIIVDDGSEAPYYAPRDMPWPVIIRRLPPKSIPKNPCLPINIGVYSANGKYIAISNPEIVHRAPILEQMREEIVRGGQNTYVIAAAWNPESKRWHCHSTIKRSDNGDVGSFLPPEADYHFMVMMHRALWVASGGFDNEYRDGAGYDDPDFVMRLARAGAHFVRRDDLVVDHPRDGARAEWTPAMFARNRELFLGKWRTN